MPGIGDEMDGAMQQAPQPGRHSGLDEAIGQLLLACRVEHSLDIAGRPQSRPPAAKAVLPHRPTHNKICTHP